jgi:Tfp pilus assembly protein PilO
MSLGIKTLDRMCLIIVVIVSVLCGYFLLSHGLKVHKQIRQENELLSKGLNDLKLSEANLERLNAVLDETRNELKALNERIPDSSRIGEFLQQLDFLMRKRKISLINLQPFPVVKEKLYSEIPIRVLCEGSFISIYQLLHDLETMGRTMVVDKFMISRTESAQECTVDFTASVFQR